MFERKSTAKNRKILATAKNIKALLALFFNSERELYLHRRKKIYSLRIFVKPRIAINKF